MQHVSEAEVKEALALNRILALKRCHSLVDDLEGVGNEAIMKAMQSYSPEKGASFRNFAAILIRREQRREMINIFLGVNVPHQIADYYELTEQIKKVEVDAGNPDDEKSSGWDYLLVPSERSNEQIEKILEALDHVSPEDKELVLAHYVEGYTTDELAAKHNLKHYTMDKRIQRIVAKVRDLLGTTYQKPDTKKRHEAIIADYKKGLTLKALRVRYKLDPKTLSIILAPHRRKKTIDREAVLAAYRAGRPLILLGSDFGVSESTMTAFVAQNGTEADRLERAKSGAKFNGRTIKNKEEVIAAFVSGESLRVIQKRFSLNYNSILRAVSAKDIAKRQAVLDRETKKRNKGIVAAYVAGDRLEDITARFKVTLPTIRIVTSDEEKAARKLARASKPRG